MCNIKMKNIMNIFLNIYRKVSILLPVDYEMYSIHKFMESSSEKIKNGSLVLDAAAGTQPYKKYFTHCKYQSTDYIDMTDIGIKHDFICNVNNIPQKNKVYDAIINTQTLEHVKDPQKVVNEFYRILKPRGKLFLTAPGCWGVHYAPNNFFTFTNYGLELIFKNAGFKVVSIKPRGGFFIYLGRMMLELPFNIYGQYLFKNGMKSMEHLKPGKINYKNPLVYLLAIPFILSLPICIILSPLIGLILDPLDKEKNFTLGYSCYCEK